MKLLALLSEYRWPAFVGGLLAMSVASSGVIVWVATRPDAPRPMKDYYEQARRWDATEAVAEASRKLGWSVRYEFPSDVPHVDGMPRPVDVHVADADGKPVTGLAGRLFAIRSSDTRLNQTADLFAMPRTPGVYRALLRVDAIGRWEMRIDVDQQGTRFVHAARLTVEPDAPGVAGR